MLFVPFTYVEPRSDKNKDEYELREVELKEGGDGGSSISLLCIIPHWANEREKGTHIA